MRDVPVVAGGARRGTAGVSAVLREGRGRARPVHGLERSAAHACDHLPALVEVGEVVGERSMQIQTNEMRRAMGETRREPQGYANPKEMRRLAASVWVDGCVATGS